LVEVTVEENVTGWLDSINQRVEDISPVADQIVDAFLEDNKINWNRGWEKLSPTYAEWKAKHYPTAGILELDGTLKRSLVSGTSDTIIRREQGGVKIGTAVPYAVFHQEGTKKMPRRPPMALSDDFISTLEQIISDFIGGA